MNNKKIGNSFESEFCELLYTHGYWVHRITQNSAGQPADVIAVKNKRAYLIDCKACSNGIFHLSRIEENQYLAMEMWESSGNGNGWFALMVNRQIYMLTRRTMITLSYRKSTLNANDIATHGLTLEGWLNL